MAEREPSGAWPHMCVREEQRNGYRRGGRGLVPVGVESFLEPGWPGQGILEPGWPGQGILKPVRKELRERLGGQGKWGPE